MCPTHKTYKAQRVPKAHCPKCWYDYIRKRHTQRTQHNTVRIVIDHQSFELRPSLGDSDKENQAFAEWQRDQIAYALRRLLNKEWSER